MTTLESTFGDSGSQVAKTSGMAIASLVCSLICCLPITTIPGAVLGLVAMFSIRGNPARKGMGLAVTGLVLGVIFTAIQAVVYPTAFEYFAKWMELVEEGPEPALTSGFAGNVGDFKAQFHGPGATASDAEVQAFIDELRGRYGEFVSARLDEQQVQQGQRGGFGQTALPFPYILEFDNATVECETEIVFSDPQTGGFLFNIGHITVYDEDLGDLHYPGGTGQPMDDTGMDEPAMDEPPGEPGDGG